MSLFFSSYGLRLHVTRPIPGLITLPDAPMPQVDVQVYLDGMLPWTGETLKALEQIWYVSPYNNECGHAMLTVWKLDGGAYFRLLYGDGTEFIVDRLGTQVWATWPDMLTLEDTAVYLLGPVLGFVLRLRGVSCLHASAISAGGQAIALVGSAGAGKSTTAAAFAGLGYPILSDDIVALHDQNGIIVVQSGYPRLCLWPASVDALYGTANALPRLTPTWDKRYLDLTRNGYQFQLQPLPLAAIYILSGRRTDQSAPSVEALPAGTGLMALIANTYATYLLDKGMRSQEFEFLGRIVSSVPLRQVNPHADSAYLSRLCDIILNDFQDLAASGVKNTKEGKRV